MNEPCEARKTARRVYPVIALLVLGLFLTGCMANSSDPSPPAAMANTPAAASVGPGYRSTDMPDPPVPTPTPDTGAIGSTGGKQGLDTPQGPSDTVASTTTAAAMSAPGWTSYSSLNAILDLAFAPDGTLWAATGGGLVHWDLRAGAYTRTLVEANKVALAPDGAVWLATWQAVCRFDGVTCQPQADPGGLVDSGVRALTVDGDGILWVGTGRGVSRFDGTSWRSYPSQVPTNDLAVAAGGEVWAATAGGVGRYQPAQDTWITYTGEHGLPDPNDNAQVIATGPGGEVWAYILWEGIYGFDASEGDATWRELELTDSSPISGPISDMALAADGTPWVATAGGTHYPGGRLAYRVGETWIDVTSEQGLISIRPIALGPAGQVAAGTNLGLGVYQDGEWRLLRDGPLHDAVRTVAVTPDGAAWFGFGRRSLAGDGGGVSRFDGRDWQYFLDDAGVEILAAGPDGSLWAGAGCEIWRFDGETWQAVAQCEEDLPSGSIIDIAFTPDGAVWVANGFALARFEGGSWTVYDKLVGSVEAEPDGALWVTGWEGTQDSFYVGRFDGEDWAIYRQADAYPGSFIPRAVTPDGLLWDLAPDGRLVSFDGGSWTEDQSWTFYELPEGLSPTGGAGMAVAPDGALWLSASGGVARFDPERAPDGAWTVYPTDGSQGRAIAFAPDGAVWFGATRFQPPEANGATPTPTVTPKPTTEPADTPQPTPTSTVTPEPTLQPTSTPGEPPQILSFTASPDPIERGGTVTLTWEAPGTVSVGITRLSEEGDIFLEPEALGLPASGSISLQVPDDYVESIKYYLGAEDSSGALYKAYVTVKIICRYDEYIAPRCPLTLDSVWAAYEPFEGGHMVWRSDTLEIYVLYADGTYETHEDTWQEGDPVDIPGTPPPGFHAPIRGFGNVYAQQPHVRERLGWATAPEAGYTMHVETIRGGSGRYPGRSIYFTLPDRRVVNLYPFTSTWEIIP